MGVKIINQLGKLFFNNRLLVIVFFSVITLFLINQMLNLKLDAGFEKNIPLNHSYMKTYLQYQHQFGGANNIMVSVEDLSGDIFNPEFFDSLKNIHDEIFFISGVDRSLVKSLFSPSTRFTEVVEDGFVGGPVIPASFTNKKEDLFTVKSNIEKAGIVGRLVSTDYRAAMISAQLMEFDPVTGVKLDPIKFANQLEQQLRKKYENEKIKIHIIGFSKMVGDIANAAKDVMFFFIIAFFITAIMVYLFSRSLVLTAFSLICSVMAVIWQLGLLNLMGFGIDPMSILVPFLVFAIAISHGVQVINSIKKRVSEGTNTYFASLATFKGLLVAGGIALLSDTVGFLTLLSIDIGIIRELAISASLGVAVIILTNLFLLPVIVSYTRLNSVSLSKNSNQHHIINKFWLIIGSCSTPKNSKLIMLIAAMIYVLALQQASKMKIGDFHKGASALHQESRYNQDTFFITDNFAITTDVLTVIAEAFPEACTYHSIMSQLDEFDWLMSNTSGISSVLSLSKIAKQVNVGFNEGNYKWHVLPRNNASLVQAVSQIPTSSGLRNTDCSVMPIYLFLNDHKASTIEPIVAKVKSLFQKMNNDKLTFKLASGPVGVIAATNEAVSEAQLPMMLYVYSAVFILCWLTFGSLKATIAVVLPLYIVSTMAQGLMTLLQIGLTVSTLPVIALGVGIGVDYGIYILSTMMQKLKLGISVQQAYVEALKERGSAVIFTGLTLAIGVSTWFFSDLKFQMDMGILLTFMFLMNMFAAIIILPAIMSLLWQKKHIDKDFSINKLSE